MQLSLTERLILANQYRIMELIDPENAEEYTRKHVAVKSGYEIDIDDLVSEFAQEADALTEEECIEVFDILDTFTALRRAYDALGDKPGIDERDIRFAGFDANNEKQYHYSHYLRQQGKWEELMPGGAINSHHPTMDRYRPMVQAWKQIPGNRRHQLTKEDVQQIVAAGRGDVRQDNVTPIR